MKTKSFYYFFSLLGMVPLAIWCFRYIGYDLWYDEIYSLENFAMTDFATTLFYYPAPNNHIFFNVTSQFISRIFGYRDIFSAEAHVHVFRSFQLLVSVATAFFSARILKRFFGIKSSFLLYAILFTTIPYLNFSLQLRGYNMSALFVVLLVYFSYSYIASKKNFSLWVVLISSMLVLYTIPSNLYVLAAFWMILFFGWYTNFKRKNTDSRLYLNLVFSISGGALLAFLLYLPILEDVIFNKFSNRGAFGPLYSFHVLRMAIVAFFSNRFLLLLLILPGIYIYYKKSTLGKKQFLFALAALFVVPFVLSFFHQKAPFPRVFAPLAPIFCMLLAIPLINFIDNIPKLYQMRAVQLLVMAYCIFVFLDETEKNDSIISRDMVENNILSQDLYRNYYLGSFFRQDSTMNLLGKIHDHYPVVKLHQRDQPSTDFYLRKYKISFFEVDSVGGISEALKRNGRIYILTSYKNKTLAALKKHGFLKVEVLTPDYSFTNIIRVGTQKE